MSKVVASYLSDGQISKSMTDVVRGAAKAWTRTACGGSGGFTFSSAASHNVSSVSVVNSYTHQINFTTPMSTANYAVATSEQTDATGSGGNAIMQACLANGGRTTSYVRITTGSGYKPSSFMGATGAAYAIDVVIFE